MRAGGLRLAQADPVFQKYWDVVELSSEQSRYSRNFRPDRESFIEAVGDKNHGVMKWVKRFW